MLIDEVEIIVKAGDGGKGVVSFGKGEKSGPDGGNGGKGGDVYVLASSDLTLLNQFQSETFVSAENGIDGGKEKRAGRMGEDLVLLFPIGSGIRDLDTGEILELNKVGDNFLLCKGGEGGTGNFELRSSRNTTPENIIPPKPGQKRRLEVILSFIADFGFIGLPSSGKSSLLNELTNTNVKTADYHFTTLTPNLGVLPNKKIIADIPGLIEGASKGKGLGIKFLKHIQKVGLLLHCLPSDSSDPIKDYKVIRKELGEFSQKLLEKDEVILVTKSDLVRDKDLEKIKTKLKKLKRKMIVTSIYDEKSIRDLMEVLSRV